MSVRPVIATPAKQATENHKELLNGVDACLVGTSWAFRRVVQENKVVLIRRCFARIYRKLVINHPLVKSRLTPE